MVDIIDILLWMRILMAYLEPYRQPLITTIGTLKVMYHARALRDVRSKKRSLVTFVISPYERIPDVIRKVDGWIYSYAMEGKGRAIEALIAAQQILEKFDRVPQNGLIIYAGPVYTDDGAKGVAIGFEPFKLIYARTNRILDRFDIEALTRLLEPDNVITQALGWVRNIITQALPWVEFFLRLLVVLVVQSFVLLVVVLAAYNVRDHDEYISHT